MELSIKHLSGVQPSEHNVKGHRENARKFFSEFEFGTPEAGDHFFEKFTIGNATDIIDKPNERFLDYEELLLELKEIDPVKYDQIHKGTPFYFMAWLSFQTRAFERAIFYMDAAISEDIRKTIHFHRRRYPGELRNDDQLSVDLSSEWIRNPAGQFLLLKDGVQPTITTITLNLRELLKKEMDRFRNETGITIDIDDFINKLIIPLATSGNTRSIATAIFSFILESIEIEKMITLRSRDGGSIEPIITYFAKGGVIFESILKQKYPDNGQGRSTKTIGDLPQNANFRNQYGITAFHGFSGDFTRLIREIGTDKTPEKSFETCYRLRNLAAHNLAWDDVFNNLANFRLIYEQVVNALFYIYEKDFK